MKRLLLAFGLLYALGSGTIFARPVSEIDLTRRSQSLQREQELLLQQQQTQRQEQAQQESQSPGASAQPQAQGTGTQTQRSASQISLDMEAQSAEAGRLKIQPTKPPRRNQRYELILLHTNDHHGTVLPASDGHGGVAQVAALVKIAKTLFPQVLLVDAGDINTGTALSNMFDAEPDIVAYNMMGYDAATFGNHEFDGNLEKLQKQMAKADFPFVTSNIKTTDETYLGLPYLLKGYEGFTVGIFGITTLRTQVIASPDKSLTFVDEIKAVQETVDFLKNREQVDIVIGLTHLGDVRESPDHVTSIDIASAVSGIDIIVDGHSHSYFDTAKKLGSTYIVTANEWGKYLGAGRLTVVNRKLAGFDWLPIPVGPDEEVVQALKGYVDQATAALGPNNIAEMIEPGAEGDASIADLPPPAPEEPEELGDELADGAEAPADEPAEPPAELAEAEPEAETEEIPAEPVSLLAGIEPQKLQPAGKVQSGKAYELILLHTNDHHGAVLPAELHGGLAQRAALVKIAKTLYPQVLLLDAGDINTGSALSKMFEAEPDIIAYNMMGYDAAALGSREFDGGLERLQKQMDAGTFPFISANVKTSSGDFLGSPYLVKAYDGFTVGIFGITSLRTKSIADPDPSLAFISEIQAVQETVDFLKNEEEVDIVIALTSLGDQKESPEHVTSLEVASEVSGIDIIVDGHSHSYFDTAKKLGGTYIVTANEWGKYLGAGRLTVVNRKLAGFDWLPIPVGPDAEVTEAMTPYIAKAEASLKEVIGKAAETFEFGDRLTRKQETALGNAICDANVWYFKEVYGQPVDFAFHNGGNMRTELPAGDITREQILTILPFENYLYVASLPGSKIIELFNFIASIPQGAGGWAQVSQEVRYTIDYRNGGKLANLAINGEPVDPNRMYRFVTNDYLLGGGDGYTVLTQAQEPFNTSLLLSYVFIEWIKSAGGTITPSTDGRITVIGN
ncbi:MAG: 5'-nucleotidase C-terminal domain-containing protein [Spirochaetaceae bacterium]|jgi:5'-nucleotidase/UDP-sugar diphosphatase|nr:5'-nucleotidase C-terminal domain-containing protein [Spirochaetaceae bacterium]